MFANWYRELQTMIDEGYYYVDKTLFIKEVLNEKVALYTDVYKRQASLLRESLNPPYSVPYI